MKNKGLQYAVFGGMIAAMYAAATMLSAVLGLAFGPIQFRFSEALCILPIFFPEAVLGLSVGCVVANLASPYGLVDVLFGTSATLLAAILTRLLRRITIKGIPVLSMLAPVVCNMIIVGAQITLFFDESASFAAFLISALQVGLGELAVILTLGIPMFLFFKRSKFNKL